MGKGDRRSRRSKIWRGTHGKRRSRKKERQKTLRKRPPQPAKETREPAEA